MDRMDASEVSLFEQHLGAVFGDRMKTDDQLCREVWSALANVVWHHGGTGEEYSLSFRAAGYLIAEIRGRGDYMDWYCSGPYATVSAEISEAMAARGWTYEELL
jgi:hypothetical protein